MIPFNNFLYEEELTEGVYDPGILKAFFTAGGPGSGKNVGTVPYETLEKGNVGTK